MGTLGGTQHTCFFRRPNSDLEIKVWLPPALLYEDRASVSNTSHPGRNLNIYKSPSFQRRCLHESQSSADGVEKIYREWILELLPAVTWETNQASSELRDYHICLLGELMTISLVLYIKFKYVFLKTLLIGIEFLYIGIDDIGKCVKIY